MTPNFDSYDDLTEYPPRDWLNKKMRNQTEYISAVKTIHRDRFELISAYLDGAASPSECALVEEWLQSDPEVQRLHARLLNLSQEWESLPVPPLQQSVEQTIEQFFARLDAEPAPAVAAVSQSDRVELLSAYIDGEVSAAEREQVEALLLSDVELQRQHARLLNLRAAIEEVPVPAAQPMEATIAQFFARLDAEAVEEVAAVSAAERVEMLSAYIDGEVSATEREQVEALLLSDVELQRQHERLLNLRAAIEEVPVPAAQPIEATLEQFFARLDAEAAPAVAAVSQSDRVEMLSAYIDGEVSATEREQVEALLLSDVEVQRQHARLLNLRAAIEEVPVPAAQPMEATIAQFFARLDAETVEEVAAVSAAERVEMLSAYIDGEVSATEREQVEAWLLSDVEVQRQHERLLNLRAAIEEVPVPAAQPIEATVEQFFARLDAEQAQEVAAAVNLQRDRYELLSAYLDGEVSAAERKHVEELLQGDPVVQGLYDRLLSLRSGMQNMPVPLAAQSVEKTVEQVFARLDRKPKLRLILGGAAAAAALAIAAVSSLLTSEPSFSPQMAKAPQPQASPEQLTIALNSPVVEIPKAVKPAQEKAMMSRALFVE